jgi:flagellar operon protein
MPSIDGVNLPFLPAGGLKELDNRTAKQPVSHPKVSFNDIFEKELDKVKFSSHAQSRLLSRDIDLTPQDVNRLQDAVKLAETKGANESLVMLDEKAFIVSVPNKTVITVVQKDDMDSKVVTNIDSAVFA